MSDEEKRIETGPLIVVVHSESGVDVQEPVGVGELLVIGRGKGAGLVLEDRDASREHVEVRYVDGMYLVRDLGSKKGTFLNGRMLSTRAQLLHRAVIRVGESVLVFLEEGKPVHGDRLAGIPGEFDKALLKAMEETGEGLPPPNTFIKAIHYERLILNGRERTGRSLEETAEKIVDRLMSRLAPEKAVAEVFYDLHGLSSRDTVDLETIRTPGPGIRN